MQSPNRWQQLFILTLIFGGLWLWFSRVPPEQRAFAQSQIAQPRAGFLAPDFEAPALDGSTIRLSDLRGQAIIVNFWATWCPPCRFEMPALQKTAQANRDRGVVVLLVNQGESPNVVEAFLQELGIDLPTLLDDGRIGAELYRVRGLPTTVFIRPDGIIEDVVVGGPMTEAFLQGKVEAMLDTN